MENCRATIMGSGSAFNNQNSPAVVVQVGASGSTGLAEISGMLFKTQGPCTSWYQYRNLDDDADISVLAAGAIVVEWNVHDPSGSQGAAGMWDSHIILVRFSA